MRRTFLSARPSRAAHQALGRLHAHLAFATISTKDDSPPSPIMRSQEQAHPVGPFYEAVMRTPKPLPKEKPEAPPVTSRASPAQEAARPNSPADKAPPAAADEAKAPTARRPRKPRQPAPAKDETKAKSVPSSLHSSSSSSSSSLSSSSASSSTTTTPSAHPGPPSDLLHSEEHEGQEERPSSNSDVQQARDAARIVFGSRLAGPAERAERLAAVRARSRVVAGVVVPPRPEEPDNCCMGGCVNCVWDRYRDEMEEWAARSAEAERRLRAAEAGAAVGVTEEAMDGVARGRNGQLGLGVHDEAVDRGAVSVDDDGGGSVGNWEVSSSSAPSPPPASPSLVGKERGDRLVRDFWDEELYKNVPVGIREFMKHEKRLKEKHLREGTAGG